MSVKTIFFTLIGTIAVLICGTLMIEFINANMNGNQFATDLRKSVMMACEYYSQESYRVSGGTSTANGDPITYVDDTGANQVLTDVDGSVVGEFYEGSTPKDIFDNLYINAPNRGEFEHAMISDISSGSYIDKIDDTKDLMISPMNYGITYMDKGTLEKIAKWTLCKNLTIKNADAAEMLRTDWTSDGRLYINSGGFLVDILNFEISDITYHKFDLTDATDRSNFQAMTGYNINTLTDTDEVIVADIQCSVPIKYIGISFLGRLLDMDIGGVDGINGAGGSGPYNAGGLEEETTADPFLGSSGNMTRMHGNIYYYTVS